jgi:hypothetical protein
MILKIDLQAAGDVIRLAEPGLPAGIAPHVHREGAAQYIFGITTAVNMMRIDHLPDKT